jgi:hypothetical protein
LAVVGRVVLAFAFVIVIVIVLFNCYFSLYFYFVLRLQIIIGIVSKILLASGWVRYPVWLTFGLLTVVALADHYSFGPLLGLIVVTCVSKVLKVYCLGSLWVSLRSRSFKKR